MRAAVDVRVTGDHIPFTQVPQGQGVARVQPEPDDMGQNPQVVAFIAELQHWRQVNGCSQKAVARLVGYTPSYVSKVERGSMLPSRSFAESADQHLGAGRAIIRRWKDMHESLEAVPAIRPRHEEPSGGEAPSAFGPGLVVEHEHGELTLRDGIYRTRVRRHVRTPGRSR